MNSKPNSYHVQFKLRPDVYKQLSESRAKGMSNDQYAKFLVLQALSSTELAEQMAERAAEGKRRLT